MNLYVFLQDTGAAIARYLQDGGLSRLTDNVPSRLSAIVHSDAALEGVSVAQAASAVVSAAFAFLLIIAIIKKRQLTPASSVAARDVSVGAAGDGYATGPLRGRWDVVRANLESQQEAHWKEAVMEADKLVDDAMAKAGFPGDTFGDRLANIPPGTLVSLDGIWWAHRIRNRLAHELDYFMRYTEARQAVGYYEQALTELKLL